MKKPTLTKKQVLHLDITKTLRSALSDTDWFGNEFVPAMEAGLAKATPAQLQGVLLLAQGFKKVRRQRDRAEATRKKAAKVWAPGEKMKKLREIVSEFNSKETTAELVQHVMDELDINMISARTYVYSALRQLGLIPAPTADEDEDEVE
jgi:hypothetical protein